MYSRPPHQDIPRDLYGLPAAPPNARTPTPAPDVRTGASPAGVLRPRSRGVHPALVIAGVLLGFALIAGLGATLLLSGI